RFLTSLSGGLAQKKELFSTLLGSLSGGSVLPAGMSARKHRELLLQALLELIEALSRPGPVLMIFEDLQWADPTSKDLLEVLAKQCRNLPLLLIAVARPEFAPTWGGEEGVPAMALAPLTQPETAALISLVPKSRDLPGPAYGYIV